MIPGFGPTLTSELVAWRQRLENQFVFNPRQGVDPADVTAIENDIQSRRRKIELEIQQGPVLLKQIAQQITSQREALRPMIAQAARLVAQAEADLKAL